MTIRASLYIKDKPALTKIHRETEKMRFSSRMEEIAERYLYLTRNCRIRMDDREAAYLRRAIETLRPLSAVTIAHLDEEIERVAAPASKSERDALKKVREADYVDRLALVEKLVS